MVRIYYDCGNCGQIFKTKDSQSSPPVKVNIKKGQTDYRAEVINKSEKHKNKLKIRQTNLHTEKRADRTLVRKFTI